VRVFRNAGIGVACLCVLGATAWWSADAVAASRGRPSGRSFSGVTSVSRSRATGRSVSGSRPSFGAVRVRPATSGVRQHRSIAYSPSSRVRSSPVSSVRSPERIRVRPTVSHHPIVRDPLNSVGRVTHLRHSYGTPRYWSPYYHHWSPYYYHHWRPYYYSGWRYWYPSYWYYSPWWWYSYYGAYYPYWYDWWWDGWGVGGTWYYSSRYDRPDRTRVEVTERVVPAGRPPEYAAPDYGTADAAQATLWFEQGRYSDAAEVYRRLSLADDADPLVGLAHVHCLIADGRYRYAAYVLRKTIEDDADWHELFMHARGYYPDWGVFVNHVATLERYVEDNPGNVAARFLLGYAYLFWDRCDDAVSLFHEVVAQEPQDRGARYLLSLAEEGANRSRQSS
jgi:hypothetical protein